MAGIDELQSVMTQLVERCPWNRAQTHASLARYAIEEAHELAEAAGRGNPADIREETGDLLYQVVFHCAIAERAGEGFDLDAIATDVAAKMRARHPHVFGENADDSVTIDEVIRMWHERKATEKRERASVLDGVPAAQSPLVTAERVIGAAERAGVPIAEVAAAPRTHEDFGAAFLALAAEAMQNGVDPDAALRAATKSLASRVDGHSSSSPDERTAL